MYICRDNTSITIGTFRVTIIEKKKTELWKSFSFPAYNPLSIEQLQESCLTRLHIPVITGQTGHF